MLGKDRLLIPLFVSLPSNMSNQKKFGSYIMPNTSDLDPLLRLLPISIALAAYVATIRVRLKERSRNSRDECEELIAKVRTKDIKDYTTLEFKDKEFIGIHHGRYIRYAERAEKLNTPDFFLISSILCFVIPILSELVVKPICSNWAKQVCIIAIKKFDIYHAVKSAFSILGIIALMTAIVFLAFSHIYRWNWIPKPLRRMMSDEEKNNYKMQTFAELQKFTNELFGNLRVLESEYSIISTSLQEEAMSKRGCEENRETDNNL